MNLALTMRLPKVLVRNLPCKLNFKLLPLTTHGFLLLFPRERKPLVVSGYTKLNTILMAPLIAIKLVLLQRGLPN